MDAQLQPLVEVELQVEVELEVELVLALEGRNLYHRATAGGSSSTTTA